MALHLHRAERTDLLADGLGQLLATPMPDPFAEELVLVSARGMERWLSQRLSHILGRGRTHLPYAQPKFGTPCAANMPQTETGAGSAPMSMMGDDDGMMAATPHAAEMDED